MISTSEGVQASETRANRKLSRVSGESMVTERVIFFNSQNIGLNPQYLITYASFMCSWPLELCRAAAEMTHYEDNCTEKE